MGADRSRDGQHLMINGTALAADWSLPPDGVTEKPPVVSVAPQPAAVAFSADDGTSVVQCRHQTAVLPDVLPTAVLDAVADPTLKAGDVLQACAEARFTQAQACAVLRQDHPATRRFRDLPDLCANVNRVYARMQRNAESPKERAARHEFEVRVEADRLRVRKEAAALVASEESTRGAPLRDRILTRAKLASLPSLYHLIADTIEMGTLGMLAGPYGSCKSFVALSWAASIATGHPWFGREVSAPGPVIYVAGEGASGLNGRLAAWEADTGVDIPDTNLLTLPLPVNFGRASEVAEFCKLVAEHKPVLVILETLNRCAVGMEENSATDMGRVVNAMYEIQRATAGGSVFVVHHAGKDGTIRGSTSLGAGMDTVYMTKGNAAAVTLARTKRKDGAADDELALRLRQVGESGVLDHVRPPDMAPDNDELLMSAFMSAFSATGCTMKQLRDEAGMPSSSFHRTLNRLVDGGKLVKVGTGTRDHYRLGTA
ncbi:AAA family ATPase [Lentzea sp. NEAU-D13]|uniref:AAA family ATPase n=1 Tax=Lentzea alba TaxID=2714351 RepID=A0A7C9RUV4_9PSEU|nr:AAA family ATPase [Lentzea alba]NGY63429.1 AAA family ATPase [Lentzea alba]